MFPGKQIKSITSVFIPFYYLSKCWGFSSYILNILKIPNRNKTKKIKLEYLFNRAINIFVVIINTFFQFLVMSFIKNNETVTVRPFVIVDHMCSAGMVYHTIVSEITPFCFLLIRGKLKKIIQNIESTDRWVSNNYVFIYLS